MTKTDAARAVVRSQDEVARAQPCGPPTALFARADALFGGTPDGVLIQREGRIVYANRRAAAILGCDDPARLIGTLALEIYPDPDLPSVLARLQSAYFGHAAPASRHALRRSDGHTTDVAVSCLLLRLADGPMLLEVLRGV